MPRQQRGRGCCVAWCAAPGFHQPTTAAAAAAAPQSGPPPVHLLALPYLAVMDLRSNCITGSFPKTMPHLLRMGNASNRLGAAYGSHCPEGNTGCVAGKVAAWDLDSDRSTAVESDAFVDFLRGARADGSVAGACVRVAEQGEVVGKGPMAACGGRSGGGCAIAAGVAERPVACASAGDGGSCWWLGGGLVVQLLWQRGCHGHCCNHGCMQSRALPVLVPGLRSCCKSRGSGALFGLCPSLPPSCGCRIATPLSLLLWRMPAPLPLSPHPPCCGPQGLPRRRCKGQGCVTQHCFFSALRVQWRLATASSLNLFSETTPSRAPCPTTSWSCR
jgi:hypothetical protein